VHKSVRYRATSVCALALIYLAIVYVAPRPESVKPEGWRLVGIFAATVGGLILQPIAGGAVVLVAVTLVAVSGSLSVAQVLAGFGDPIVWLVMSAFFISHGLIKTGLARRIALLFVRAIGRTSLGVTYALSATDLVLASIIPSNGARSGGVVLPIARSIAELYGSHPGPTAARFGQYLICALYQSICITCAMFLTGQASNPLAAQIATTTFHYPITWLSWLVAGLVPGLCSLAAIPYIIYRMYPPEIKRTPEASRFAASELLKMGPMDRPQKIMLTIFVTVCGLWVTTPFHGIDITVTALAGTCALLVTGVLTWEDIVTDRAAWDIFIWYAGLVRMGKALGDAGVTAAFAKGVGVTFEHASWVTLFAIALAVYFYVHYGLASITAHMLAMFVPFCAVLIARGAPTGLVLYAFACFVNFSSGLTNYGTTPSPMFFSTGYVSFKQWWTAGFFISLLNLAIWSTIGFWWWKIIGIW
jgi:DASS family divalent anion:Na+ symporter